ncbi:C39 family peptidase [Terrabacter sp. MAHUQ-38]|uniref:C39 family peptidase n=1 Tax=unclassified Terrabacter TaxID=2630222 RepID=UPI00165E29FB|nr:C39 family peptidase [Terrabacter sp. MAHUQ-38]MBC9823585.1 C39 family peptidase [Terrabacter sp. MAHUQ-38]
MPSRSVVSDVPFQPSRRTLLTSAAAGAALTGAGLRGATRARAAQTKKGDPPRQVAYVSWEGADLAFGPFDRTIDYVDPHGTSTRPVRYDVATWTSPVVAPGFPLTELVASWNATTPGGSWVEVRVRGTSAGATTKDYVLGRWATKDPADGGGIHRTSLAGQGDTVATVLTDTLATRSGYTLTDWQLEVRLMRVPGSGDTPTVAVVGAMASALPDTKKVPRSANGPACGTVLDVPTYSQEVHVGHYPQWDNGGEAWCSPTSTSMVVAYWGAGPTADETAWVDPAVDAQVDFTARNVFDYTYDGAGNWPFNTAYAATRGDLRGFVTRLRSLTEAEAFIAAGIPLVVSVSFKKGELTGAGYGTNGHLMVVVGFTESGDVVCNDPASHLLASDEQVRVTYLREEFENVWVPHSGGIVYVIHPGDRPLPPAPAQANW